MEEYTISRKKVKTETSGGKREKRKKEENKEKWWMQGKKITIV